MVKPKKSEIIFPKSLVFCHKATDQRQRLYIGILLRLAGRVHSMNAVRLGISFRQGDDPSFYTSHCHLSRVGQLTPSDHMEGAPSLMTCNILYVSKKCRSQCSGGWMFCQRRSATSDFFLERNKNARYINIQMERMKYYLHRLLPPEFRRVAQMAEKKIDRTITSIHLQSEFFNLQSEDRTHWLSLFLMPSMKPLLMQPSCIQPFCRPNDPDHQYKGPLARKWAFITSLRERYNHDNTRPCC